MLVAIILSNVIIWMLKRVIIGVPNQVWFFIVPIILILLVSIPLINLILLTVNRLVLITHGNGAINLIADVLLIILVLLIENPLSIKVIEPTDFSVNLPQFLILFWCAA